MNGAVVRRWAMPPGGREVEGESDVGLDATAQSTPPALAATAPSTPPGLAPTVAASSAAGQAISGTLATEAAPTPASLPSTLRPARAARYAMAAHRLNLFVAALSAANVAYFVWRFLASASPPALHQAYVGEVHGGPFQAMDIFDGPLLTLSRITLVAALFVVTSTFVAYRHRNNTLIQLISIAAAVAGQSSIAVAVLTSSETLVLPRIVCAGIYVLMPLAGFSIMAYFPDGRPVPRWAPLTIPVGLAPFVAQAAYMFHTRGFSVPLAAACFPLGVAFLGFQWVRYRKHATLRDRHQIKWASYAGGVFMIMQAAAISMIPLLAHRDSPAFPFIRVLFELVLASSYLGALVCLLFSAARYRLWDIDRVINRTIVYALVTGLLGAVCMLGYFGLRAALSGVGPIISIALSLAVMVALFTPTRRRIARLIDRKFYGIGLDYEALAARAVRAADDHSVLPTTATELGAYDELALLGRGGMGAVYRAHHAEFGVPVALKVMSPKLAGDPDAQARFRREAQILEGLQHPNVVPFLAAGHEAGLAFIAMQYVEGEDLGAFARRHRGSLTIDEVAPLITGIAAALDVAHRRGVVHRDIKPANVLLEGRADQPLGVRRPLVMDFGVARLASDPSAADPSMVGSLPYIAPEQIHNGDRVDGRADVYALAATTYELLTGRPPFVEPTALGLVLAHLHQPPADPRSIAPSIPAETAGAILRGLAKAPAERFETAGEFAAALRA